MTCIITGAVAHNGHAWVGGDLHLIGGCYVFNAIVTGGETRWCEDRAEYAHYTKEIDFSSAKDYWERRGTIIAPEGQAYLNAEAWEFVGRAPR